MATPSIKSIQRCFEILSAFTKMGNPQLDASQISRVISIPTSSLYRHLQTLTEQSALTYNPQSKKFSLGPLILKLSAIANKNIDIQLIAKPLMQKLCDEVQETVYLTGIIRYKEGYKAICIEKVDCKKSVRYIIERGDIFSIHASATGRVLMAYLPTEIQERIIAQGLKRFTKYTITDPAKMRKCLKEIRKNGFTSSSQELGMGGMAISAPIFNSQTKIVAGLSIAAPVERFREKNMMQFSGLLIDYANRISALIGYDLEQNHSTN